MSDESFPPTRYRLCNEHFLGACFICMGLFLIFCTQMPHFGRNGEPATFGEVCFFGSIGFLLLAGGIWAVARRLYAAIVVTDIDLRWRDLGSDWQTIPWSDVVDYRTLVSMYSAMSGKQVSGYEVVTRHRTIRFSGDWVRSGELAETIKQRATAARVTGWELLGSRPIDDWPRTFSYWDPRWKLRAACIVLGSALATALYIQRSATYVHWMAGLIGWESTFPVVVGFALLLAALLALPGMTLAHYLRGWSRRGARFRVTPDAFRYSDAATGEDITAPWSEVSDYFHRPIRGGLRSRYVLVLRGADEKQVSWDAGLVESPLLLAIVRRYAPHPANSVADAAEWRTWSVSDQTSGTDPSTWKGGAVGMGDRVFSYRTPGIVVALSMLTAMLLCMNLMVLQLASAPEKGALYIFLMLLPVDLFLIWGWVSWIRCRTEVDELGITNYSLFGKRHLYWFAIDDYGEVLSRRTGTSLSIWLTGRDGTRFKCGAELNGYKELRQEIERCAPPPKTGWIAAKTKTADARSSDIPTGKSLYHEARDEQTPLTLTGRRDR